MPVTPQQLRSLRFDEGIRGYDKRQVDKVIRRVADLVEDLESRLADAERRAGAAGEVPTPAGGEAAELDETLRRTLILAQRTADAAIKEAREDAARIRAEARTEADELLADARSKNDKVTNEVEAEKARMLAEARQDCDARIAKVLAELRETHEAKRTELIEQVDQLTQVRDQLSEDIERLEAYLGTRRERIRAALAEITGVLDDPGSLHPAEDEAPQVAAVAEVEGYDPVVIDIRSMEDLGEPTQAVPVVDGGDGDGEEPAGEAAAGDQGASGQPAPAYAVAAAGQQASAEASAEPARPAWADSVPRTGDDTADGMVGQPRRGTGTAEDPEAMERFFHDQGDDRRSGWFRRKA